MKFNQPTSDFLSKMGWTDSRSVDTHSFLECLLNDGYKLFPASSAFLKNFGGLDGAMPAYRKDGVFERIHFNIEEAINNIYREKVITYEERVGEQLVVIGEAYNGHLTLLLSASERVYGGYDDYLCLLGNTVEQGITALFERTTVSEVP